MVEWSPYQQAVFDNVQHGEGHTVVVARAGGSKTTVLVESLNRISESSLILAFNTSIAKELARKVPRHVRASTCHSFGLGCLRQSFGHVTVDTTHLDDVMLDEIPGHDRFTWLLRRQLTRAVRLAKGLPRIATDEEIESILTERCDLEEGVGIEFAIEVVGRVLDMQAKFESRRVDFDDMIWLPLVTKARIPLHARIFIDETQDLSAAQVELSLRACKRSGRVLAVGDDRQSVYQFRGADANSIPNLVKRLDATTLPLPISYRCANAIIAEAQRYVPDIQARPDAPDGIVRRISGIDASLRIIPEMADGDFVLSRTNAPLVPITIELLRRGQRCAIMGRDFGAGLDDLISKLGIESPGRELVVKTARWAEAEAAKRTAAGKDPDPVLDRAAALRAVADGCGSIGEVRARIAKLFEDGDDSSRVTLATTHKAKGLERDRVWMLMHTYRPGVTVEEDNLIYVAITRARETLVIVRDEEKKR